MSGELLTPGEVLERLVCPWCGEVWNGAACGRCDSPADSEWTRRLLGFKERLPRISGQQKPV
jgi:hypothetical protein